MRIHRISRREMIESCIVKGTLMAGAVTLSQPNLLAAWQEAELAATTSTPEEVLGPFYKKGAPNVRVLRQPQDPGFPLRVTGHVWNTRGASVPNASLDIWHTDFYGLYDLEGYKYHAKINPDQDGGYAVETIIPGHYPDRPAQHIHYLVRAPGHRGVGPFQSNSIHPRQHLRLRHSFRQTARFWLTRTTGSVSSACGKFHRRGSGL